MSIDSDGFEAKPAASPRHYAAFSQRVMGLSLDGAIYGAALAVAVILTELLRDTGGLVRLPFTALCIFVFLYEPLFISKRGGTLGHTAANLRVARVDNDIPPSFLPAVGRFWVKALLGWLSFVTMAITSRHQAVHDLTSRSVVLIRNPQLAAPHHILAERQVPPAEELPSRTRRVAAIVGHAGAAFALYGLVTGLMLSEECFWNDFCSPPEAAFDTGLTALFVLSVIAVIILGWQGFLIGARRKPGGVATDEVS